MSPEDIASRLRIPVSELKRCGVVWEGERFPITAFVKANKDSPEVLDRLFSEKPGTQIRVGVGGGWSEPFYLVIDPPASNAKKPQKKKAISPLDYYTVEGHYVGGAFFAKVEHVRGSEVLSAKRSISASADEGERIRYVVLHEGATPKKVSAYQRPKRLF